MKYGTKLLVLLIAVPLLTSGVAVGIMYWEVRGQMLEELQSTALSIASTAAALIDGDKHKQVRKQSDEDSPEYQELVGLLRRVRDANRRDDLHVAFVYTLVPSPGDASVLQFVLDAEESIKDRSRIGEVYRARKGRVFDIERPGADASFREDQWGTWLSANAPVRDGNGQTVAAVVADVAVDSIEGAFAKALEAGGFALVVGGVLALGLAFWLSRQVSRPLNQLRDAVEEIGKGNLEARVALTSADEFGAVGRALNSMAAGLRERETLRSTFARYMAPQVMDSLLALGGVPQVSGQRRRITVLFADIRGFTQLSEGMCPEEVVGLLNTYFERMIEVLLRNHGTLNKFLGDGLMAIFGAPKDDAYQEKHAVQAALEMLAELEKLQEEWRREGRPPLRIGIGINSGSAIIGNVGSSQRMEYTAIGDTVNLASRLETATKELAVDILVSEYTYDAVRGLFRTRDLGAIKVKGRTAPVTAFAVEGAREPAGRALSSGPGAAPGKTAPAAAPTPAGTLESVL